MQTRNGTCLWRFLCVMVCAVVAWLGGAASVCATDDAGLFDLSLEQLSEVEIKSDIASIRAKTIREQPGIVSVITSRQIHETGARDLSDVLMLVPGFSLDTDVQSMVGLTFRGFQGQEGKVLLVIDGIEVNEPFYGSLPILYHVPAEVIQQVEIIRGPGSAMYGGMAGLSVVRITTKGVSQNGGYVALTPSYADGRFAENYAAGLGYAKDDWRLSFNGTYSDNYLSNRRYTSLSGVSVDLTDEATMTPAFFDLGLGYRDLDLRFIADLYRYDDAVSFGDPPESPIDTKFDSILAAAKYDWQVTDGVKVTPQFTYRRQVPWNVADPETVGYFNMEAERYQEDLSSVAELTENSSLLVGVRYQHDTARPRDDVSDEGRSECDDIAGYAQCDWDTRWVNVSAGGRYEDQDAVGGHFVPRLALTKAWDAFHVKALYSEAFRTPGFNVVNDAMVEPIEAEHTANYELESGYRFSDSQSCVVNVFYMQVDKPIIYDSGGSSTGEDGYYNSTNRLSTYGLEAEWRWDHPRVSSRLSYSFYRAKDNDLDYVRGDEERFLAAPAHKVTFSETWHILKALDWNLNGFWLSRRLAYGYPSDGVVELDPEFVLNTFLEYRLRRVSIGVGGANLLDDDRFAPQPYAGGSGALPLKGREVFARLAYSF